MCSSICLIQAYVKGEKCEIAIVTQQTRRKKEWLTGQTNRQDKDKQQQQTTVLFLIADKCLKGGTITRGNASLLVISLSLNWKTQTLLFHSSITISHSLCLCVSHIPLCVATLFPSPVQSRQRAGDKEKRKKRGRRRREKGEASACTYRTN